MLDDLAGVIETLQGRIRNYGDTLRQNEIRTRVALIDPLLQALGWDVADPGLATPEYEISGQRVDYALLGTEGKPAATVEAKKLGEPLASHRMQMLNYSNAAGIAYAGLTDGNQWELYEVFKQVTLEERRLLDLRLLDTSAHECALKLLLLWRPNLATGRPVAAGKPIATSPVEPVFEHQPSAQSGEPSPGEGWIPLAAIQTGGNLITGVAERLRPSAIRLPDGRESHASNWWHIPREVAEYLIGTGKLTPAQCPLGESRNAPIVTAQRRPDRNGNFGHLHELSNGCFLSKVNTGAGLVNNAKFLLHHCGVDPGQVWLKLG